MVPLWYIDSNWRLLRCRFEARGAKEALKETWGEDSNGTYARRSRDFTKEGARSPSGRNSKGWAISKDESFWHIAKNSERITPKGCHLGEIKSHSEERADVDTQSKDIDKYTVTDLWRYVACSWNLKRSSSLFILERYASLTEKEKQGVQTWWSPQT